MKVLTFDDEKEWLEARRCKITGTRLKDIVVKRGTGRKIGFYELIAERLGIPGDGEDPIERGHRLQEEAIERFEEMTGKKVDQTLVVWTRDDNENIAVSPDGVIGEHATEAVEIKCLSSARHLQAVIENCIPDEFRFQVIQYFIVNEKLETLYFCLYDPRLQVKDFHVIEVTREQMAVEIAEMIDYQTTTLAEVDRLVAELMQF